MPFLDQIDLLLVMTVVPGFGGQPFMPETMAKVRAAAVASRRAAPGFTYRIEVDGGITVETAAIAIAHGADTLVAGTSVFAASDMPAAVRRMRGSAAQSDRTPAVH